MTTRNTKKTRMPPWGMIIMGMLVIAFIGFIMYLSKMKPGQGELDRLLQPEYNQSSPQQDSEKNIEDSTLNDSLINPPLPDDVKILEEDSQSNFDFYNILPDGKIPNTTPKTVKPKKPKKTKKPKIVKPKKPKKSKIVKPAKQKKYKTSFAPGATYLVQTGSFKNLKDADAMRAGILLLGLNPAIKTVTIQGLKYHRVQLGPFVTPKSLHFAQNKLGQNFKPFLTIKVK
ncbi:MAG: hypothetical protein DRQ51_05290 [Gammaproteobacteria bacterium]|nr:MAG: hypothetical protein DRQ51_05290 [Gammaproteobacteria bacterium]